jgi:hypothetical protein
MRCRVVLCIIALSCIVIHDMMINYKPKPAGLRPLAGYRHTVGKPVGYGYGVYPYPCRVGVRGSRVRCTLTRPEGYP